MRSTSTPGCTVVDAIADENCSNVAFRHGVATSSCLVKVHVGSDICIDALLAQGICITFSAPYHTSAKENTTSISVGDHTTFTMTEVFKTTAIHTTVVTMSIPGPVTTVYVTASTTSVSSASSLSGSLSNSSPSSCSGTVKAPAPTQSGIVAGCAKWYVAKADDNCSKVAKSYGIDVNTFMAWNPAVMAPDCTLMLPDDAYCVAICASSSYPVLSSGTFTSTATTSSGPSGSAITTPTSYPSLSNGASSATCVSSVAPPAGKATQPGTVSGCLKWYIAQSGDTCESIGQKFGITGNIFMAWNLAVGPPCCIRLYPGDVYCVAWCG